MKKIAATFSVVLLLVSATSVFAKGRLVVYCSNEPFACQAVADEFSKKYDVKVQMTRAGSGSTYAKILAEKDNPKGDVWYAGTLDPHSQAGSGSVPSATCSGSPLRAGKPCGRHCRTPLPGGRVSGTPFGGRPAWPLPADG